MGNEPTKQQGPRVHRLPAEREGESEIIRNYNAKDGLKSRLHDDITTLHDSFRRAAERWPNKNCFGSRQGDGPYQWLNYQTVYNRAQNIGSGLVKLGLKPHSDMVGIYSINKVEWMLVEEASFCYSLCVVPLYDTLGPEACSYIINQTELPLVFCTGDKVKLLLDSVDKLQSLKYIILFDALTDEVKARAQEKRITMLTIQELEQSGAENPVPLAPPKPEDNLTICYTSGTTGDPKGVILTHQNMLADITGAIMHGITLGPDDVHISYLPLAHVLERVVIHAVLYFGGAVGFYRGEIPKLFDDIMELKPTLFVSVPRMWNRLYDKVMAGIGGAGAVKQTLFDTAFETKSEGLKSGGYTHALWDNLVFNNIRSRLGGNVRVMLTGSAPISPKVLEFLRICFACPVLEGYGQTENAAAATITTMDDTVAGHVGVPVSCIELKLVDVPEMDYLASQKPYPRGEICFRGPVVTQGYYRSAEKTAEAIDEHGWLHSGDIGLIDEHGNLKIIDRKKNIFKLSQGEYVAPEKIENALIQSKWVAQCFVHGESLKSSLVAIVVPDPETLLPWAKETGKPEDLEQLCRDPEVKKLISDDLAATGKKNDLRGFEFVRDIYLTPTAFSVQNDLLTPTFKLKRPQAKVAFLPQIEEMYQNLD